MRFQRPWVLALAVAPLWISACAVAGWPRSGHEREVRSDGISFRYDVRTFVTHTARREPRKTMQENGTDIPVDVAPERTRIVLGLSPERWEDYVLGSFILVTPLRDASAGSFAEAYPSVDDAARTLRALLDSGGVPDKKQLETAMHCVDGEIALYSRLEKVRTHNLAGFAFLVQMTQEEHPNPANNGDLRYQFAGLTADGAHMVEATFRVKHPALPKDQAATGDTGRDDAGAYLRRDEKRLAEYSEGSFEPSLGLLKTLLRSIAVTH